jgi:hypothetical protein
LVNYPIFFFKWPAPKHLLGLFSQKLVGNRLTLCVINVIFALKAVNYTVAQFQSYVVFAGGKVRGHVLTFAPKINALQAGEQLRT